MPLPEYKKRLLKICSFFHDALGRGKYKIYIDLGKSLPSFDDAWRNLSVCGKRLPEGPVFGFSPCVVSKIAEREARC